MRSRRAKWLTVLPIMALTLGSSLPSPVAAAISPHSPNHGTITRSERTPRPAPPHATSRKDSGPDAESSESWHPDLLQINLPTTATAGDKITVSVQATAAEGVRRIAAELEGPSGQKFSYWLYFTGKDDWYTRGISLSPNLAPGVWSLKGLYLQSDNGRDAYLKAGSDYDAKKITIAASGAPVDGLAPTVSAAGFTTSETVQGRHVQIAAKVNDDLSGVGIISAIVAMRGGTPVKLPPSDPLPPGVAQPDWEDDSTVWVEEVPLKLDDKSGLYVGGFLAPVTPLGTINIAQLHVQDEVGNDQVLTYPAGLARDLTGQGGPNLSAVLSVKERKIDHPTSPNLNLFHGNLDFVSWGMADQAYLLSLFDQLDAAPTTVRMTTLGQLPALQKAEEAAAKELAGGAIPLLSPATSGKLWVLDKAIRGRLLLYAELQRRTGAATDTPLTRTELSDAINPLTDWSGADTLGSRDHIAAGDALVAALQEALPELTLPKALMSAPHGLPRTPEALHFWDPRHIWMMPLRNGGASGVHFEDQSEELRIYTDDPYPDYLLGVLAHEMGHHFDSAFYTGRDADSAEAYKDYLHIRQMPFQDRIGHDGLTWENWAEDFAYLALPTDLATTWVGAYIGQQYPPLVRYPDEVEQMRALLATLAKAAPQPDLQITPASGLAINTRPTLMLTGSWLPGGGLQVQPLPLTVSNLLGDSFPYPDESATHDLVGKNGRFSLKYPSPNLGDVQLLNILASKPDNSPADQRLLVNLYTRLTLDPLPVRQDLPGKLAVSGRALDSAQILVAGVPVKPFVDGSFKADVPLQQGTNRIDVVALDADGTPLVTGQEVQVGTNKLPLTVGLPSIVKDLNPLLTGQTQPFATIKVTVLNTGEKVSATADSDGHFSLQVPLTTGANTIQVTASASDAAANGSSAWTGSVWVDRTPPKLTLHTPLHTNAKSPTLSGTVEVGSTVTVDGVPASVDGAGHWHVTLEWPDDGILESTVVATDVAGNSTHASATIQHNEEQALTTADQRIFVSGTAPTGALVAYGDAQTTAAEDGSYALPVSLQPGENHLEIQISQQGETIGYDEVNVFLPLAIDVPSYTNLSSLTLFGRSTPGSQVTLEDAPLTLSDQGSFRTSVDLPIIGDNTLHFATTLPDGSSWWLHWTIKRVSDIPLTTQDAILRIPGTYAVGTVITLEGTDLRWVTTDEHASLDIPLAPGHNVLRLHVQTPNGDQWLELYAVDRTE